MTTCTNGPWSVSTISGYGIVGVVLNAQRFSPRGLTIRGDLDGKQYSTSEAAFAAALEHGYLQPYSRNLCKFVMSRAARRRGYATDDRWYTLRAEAASQAR